MVNNYVGMYVEYPILNWMFFKKAKKFVWWSALRIDVLNTQWMSQQQLSLTKFNTGIVLTLNVAYFNRVYILCGDIWKCFVGTFAVYVRGIWLICKWQVHCSMNTELISAIFTTFTFILNGHFGMYFTNCTRIFLFPFEFLVNRHSL